MNIYYIHNIEIIHLVTIIIGTLFVLLAIPLILNRIKPNIWYGFRTKKTMSNSRIWYKANKFMGWCLLYAGIFIIVGSIILNSINLSSELYSLIFILPLILFPLTISVVLSFIYLERL